MTPTDTDHPEAYDRDRGRGILTGNDWDLLLGSSEKDTRQNRRRLRQRFRNALLDFRVLFDKWDPAERDQAFIKQTDHERQVGERGGPPGTIYADREIHRGCVPLVALVFQQYYHPARDEPEESFRRLLVDGIGLALETMDVNVKYEVDLEIKPVDQFVAEARQKYEQGERVDIKDLSRLVNAGVIPPHDIPLRRPEDDSQ